MEFRLLLIFALLNVVVITVSNATLPAEVYWHSKLPNTPLPQHLRNLLQPDTGDKEHTSWQILEKEYIRYNKRYENSIEDDVEEMVEKFHKHNLPNSTIFFKYNDLQVGQKMRLHITKPTSNARILPHQVANSIPFSIDKLSEIFQRFAVKPESLEAKFITRTIKDCGSNAIKGEERYCATSLESLVDFSVKNVGNEVQLVFNEIDEPKDEQEYTIMDVKFVGAKHVVCHKQKYPYAVFYCHTLKSSKVYTAELVGSDGTKAKAVALCHSDTSGWNPGHLAFLILNLKPGDGTTLCHFVKSDTFVMVSKN